MIFSAYIISDRVKRGSITKPVYLGMCGKSVCGSTRTNEDTFEDGTWNPGIYFTTTFSLFKMFNREKMLYHPLMSKYAMRHLATGQLPRALSHDIVISW